ncbi:uncharacterized protein SPPG_06399 [Spizellomyces punctatus DAOM BR117]|uniref:Uncharacterized protein n=1 Tax=Spizellomyces punctatus (strain DAOM BR117) TaxID=645134 RepID=A0A0L0HC04_SPIPD|nr:uncharacterized protein SPPG_06399 [Spizellomyces punctatus DAOM BR117]KNC98722.1 hypothetical protein SPPG_06399 [Spizellomyces punctatus DAOM BR117]|eukprot:XP_016606762.1 hypothetical protein SPPG_06399 [Spizellomyces punctatus DAOM BR117]
MERTQATSQVFRPSTLLQADRSFCEGMNRAQATSQFVLANHPDSESTISAPIFQEFEVSVKQARARGTVYGLACNDLGSAMSVESQATSRSRSASIGSLARKSALSCAESLEPVVVDRFSTLTRPKEGCSSAGAKWGKGKRGFVRKMRRLFVR